MDRLRAYTMSTEMSSPPDKKAEPGGLFYCRISRYAVGITPVTSLKILLK